eukprot:NODE_14495_length_236_cov_22.053476_g13582_i0.p2 GENE.NODE_14495_length_236_cov_22.053476_g13582_i0~~NODE_14495_length_236_cov_22.053476_g13582_i0.p2  ORF type:complete len:56 (+),score=19.13 NODE_14495_length_236_cov_22.053476_g13582_i0:30-170(+)
MGAKMQMLSQQVRREKLNRLRDSPFDFMQRNMAVTANVRAYKARWD